MTPYLYAQCDFCNLMRQALISLLLLSSLLTPSCKDDVFCTDEFKMIGLVIRDQTLDDHYTINMESGDTLRFNSYQYENWYVILTDQYRDDLNKNSAIFRFLGIRDKQPVVDERFEIGADQCHIYKISGRDSL